jgi:short-subunit dehydrogenase
MGRDVIVITGASAGVGRLLARRFAADGAAVALLARGQAGLDAAAADVRSAGGEPLAIRCDVADADAVERAAAEVEERLGPIDIWVNNAMTAVLGEIADTTAEEFRRVTEVTYLGTVHGTQAALRRMLPRDSGTIVQVGSALAHRSIPLQATYCAAKHAIKALTESLHVELRHRRSKVRCTMVQLPGLNTTQFSQVRLHTPRLARPVAPAYQPEVAVDAIHWAAHHPRREWWVGFSTVKTIVGNRLSPGIVGWQLGRSAFDGQQTDQPVPADRRDYLFAPLDDEVDRGVHGPFGGEARTHSVQARLSRLLRR